MSPPVESPSASSSGDRSAIRGRPKRRVVALTGATTFLGRNLVAMLEADETTSSIVALDVAAPPSAGPKTRFYRIDLTQPGVDARLAEILATERVDALLHLAFLSSPAVSSAWAHELESVGTMHLVNACREHDLGKLVLASSTALYGPHPSNPNFLTERHPLRGIAGESFLSDKIEAEAEIERLAGSKRTTSVTILRLAPLVGPTVRNYVTRWLSRRLVPTVIGHDPLMQCLHEVDGIAALRTALDSDVSGVFNIVGEGVLPLSTVLRLAGRTAIPLPYRAAKAVGALLWAGGLAEAPSTFVRFLRYLCVADGREARERLGFYPAYSIREAVLDFGGALRMREARLLGEAT